MKPKVLGWKIWYGDGSIFSSKEGDWDSAPHQNVQVVMVYYGMLDGLGRHMRSMHSGLDFYFKDGDDFGSTSDIRMIMGTVKYGKWMWPEEEFEKVRLLALEDYKI